MIFSPLVGISADTLSAQPFTQNKNDSLTPYATNQGMQAGTAWKLCNGIYNSLYILQLA